MPCLLLVVLFGCGAPVRSPAQPALPWVDGSHSFSFELAAENARLRTELESWQGPAPTAPRGGAP